MSVFSGDRGIAVTEAEYGNSVMLMSLCHRSALAGPVD
jgi:hypothetical protein